MYDQLKTDFLEKNDNLAKVMSEYCQKDELDPWFLKLHDVNKSSVRTEKAEGVSFLLKIFSIAMTKDSQKNVGKKTMNSPFDWSKEKELVDDFLIDLQALLTDSSNDDSFDVGWLSFISNDFYHRRLAYKTAKTNIDFAINRLFSDKLTEISTEILQNAYKGELNTKTNFLDKDLNLNFPVIYQILWAMDAGYQFRDSKIKLDINIMKYENPEILI